MRKKCAYSVERPTTVGEKQTEIIILSLSSPAGSYN